MAAGLHAQDAEAIFFIVEGNPLDESRQNFKIVLDRHGLL